MMYGFVRYHLIPPLFMIFFTVLTQWLVSLGNPERAFTKATFWNAGTLFSWMVVLCFFLWCFLSLKVPSRVFSGPPSPSGYVPKYSANGSQFYFVSLTAYFVLIYSLPHLPLKIFINFGDIIATLNIFSLLFCVFLLLKGRLYPEVANGAVDKPLLYQMYAGLELHPRLLGVDIKQWTNCRVGMMGWALLVINFSISSIALNGFNFGPVINATLINIYLFKFFYWETGYFNTLDITLDRAGYYLCWGCLVWVQIFYTFSSYFMVRHASYVSIQEAFVIAILGVLSIILNYMADYQKQKFKDNGGHTYIWGRLAKFLDVEYTSNDGKRKKSKLLISGFWGISRHMNYVFEIMVAVCWSLPARQHGLAPFLYVAFLAILLVHRTFRDEEKCSSKYGKGWDKYCKLVPFRMIPYIF